MKTYLYLVLLSLSLWSTFLVSANTDCSGDCQSEDVLDAQSVASSPNIAISNATVFADPNVTALTPNRRLMHDRWYRRVISRATVYDAPNGNIIRYIEEGFNFVTVLSDENGWTRINTDEYVQSSLLQETNGIISAFTGIEIPESGLDYPMAWLLVNLYPSPEAGANPLESLGFMYRYTRVNIYATQDIDGYRWYQIAEGKWVHQHHVAKVNPLTEIPETVDTDLWVGIDLYEQVLTVYHSGQPIFATLVATGLPRWPTYEGTFHIYYRNPREYMTWGAVGDDFYSLEEVPWTMFFDDGRALHGAYWHDGFGYRRSHGCVNMSITDAKWLYDLVAEQMGSQRSADREQGPAVYVYSSDTYD